MENIIEVSKAELVEIEAKAWYQASLEVCDVHSSFCEYRESLIHEILKEKTGRCLIPLLNEGKEVLTGKTPIIEKVLYPHGITRDEYKHEMGLDLPITTKYHIIDINEDTGLVAVFSKESLQALQLLTTLYLPTTIKVRIV